MCVSAIAVTFTLDLFGLTVTMIAASSPEARSPICHVLFSSSKEAPETSTFELIMSEPSSFKSLSETVTF